MTTPTNTEIVLTVLDSLNAGELDRCTELMHPDFLINLAGVPGQLVGLDHWRAGVEKLRSAFPDARLEAQDAFGSGDRVALRNILTGTHTGGDFEGIAPTGRRIEVMSNELYRVGNGLIVEEWIVTDNATMFAQLTGS